MLSGALVCVCLTVAWHWFLFSSFFFLIDLLFVVILA